MDKDFLSLLLVIEGQLTFSSLWVSILLLLSFALRPDIICLSCLESFLNILIHNWYVFKSYYRHNWSYFHHLKANQYFF